MDLLYYPGWVKLASDNLTEFATTPNVGVGLYGQSKTELPEEGQMRVLLCLLVQCHKTVMCLC